MKLSSDGAAGRNVTGGCRCGACRYALAGDDLPPVYCCHCRDCQTWSGSSFTMQAVARPDQLTATGPIIPYSRANSLGGGTTQHVCGTCHTRLWNENSARPGLIVRRAGTLDRSDELSPRAHIWTTRKQPWILIADDVPRWPERAAPAEFIAALRARPSA